MKVQVPIEKNLDMGRDNIDIKYVDLDGDRESDRYLDANLRVTIKLNTGVKEERIRV